MFPPEIESLAVAVLDRARSRGLRIATAESCTGGLVAGALTAIAGSSDVVEGGFVTYSNGAKSRLLGVPQGLIEAHGAVSEPVARAMAEGAARALGADLAVSVTGVAGPGGGTAAKPVGLVHFGAASAAGVRHRAERFGDIGREAVRLASVTTALRMLLDLMDDDG
ncbi:MAG: CinA family protein [Caulobacteraceae bacterium]